MSRAVLRETKARYPSCRCHKFGLLPGLYIEDLWMLEEGCTGTQNGGAGYVCSRLDAVRRHYRPWDIRR